MKYAMLLLFMLSCLASQGQTVKFDNDQQAVYDVIERLFDGMRAGDSSIVHSVFSDDVRMYTHSKDSKGDLKLTEGSLKDFLIAVGTPHDQIWDEKIWNTRVNVEMGVAQVWTEYAFYVGDTFSHCGIDAFQLIEQNGWKIIHLIDTRKKMNCEKPK